MRELLSLDWCSVEHGPTSIKVDLQDDCWVPEAPSKASIAVPFLQSGAARPTGELKKTP
jgi:hypothetical protein